MSEIYAGRCACGAIRYKITGEPIAELHCQCLDCQRRSGAGHSAYMAFVNRADLVLAGKVKTWGISGDSGAKKHHAFCPNCGAPIFVTFPATPELIAIHPGSFDDPSRFAPKIVTYAMRARPWDVLDQALLKFDKMPPR